MLGRLLIMSVAALMAFTFTASSSSEKITRQIPVTEDFIEGRIGSTEGGNSFKYRVYVLPVNGVLEFCGVLAFGPGTYERDFKRFLRDSGFRINGKVVLKDLTYWNVAKRGELDRSVANCQSTGVSANTKVTSLSMAWSKRRYRM
ncbi:hypothetical protein [Ovoidimarina sediminis]|uniref:hypothetical protein n=1 Tax=Ovoidimarina sediminis TaxID=3079856 RepID=UPI00291348DD|nr:hypothetical protein [Rhodophyticola sp. MJ-SS7]MDU8943480.1 hypothetical protein [Rhodophyticola sp. MJ-SS7]